MSARDITDLSTICLKVIAKSPTDFISEKSLKRAYQSYANSLINTTSQLLIDYISDAGRMTDDVFPADAFATERTSLSLKNSKISAKYLLEVLKRCPKLKHLDISGCFLIDDDVVSNILDLCPQIQSFCIRNCRKITDHALVQISLKAAHLTALNIGGNINVSDKGLQRFVREYRNVQVLEELHLSGLPITENLLKLLAQNCKSLQILSIAYAIISPPMLESFMVVVGRGLKYLNVAWVEAMIAPYTTEATTLNTDLDYIDIIRRHCPLLVSLDVTGMKNINFMALSQLLEYKHDQARTMI